MKTPEMILFDYGNTLIIESEYDQSEANRAIMSHVVENPDDVTCEQLGRRNDEIFGYLMSNAHNNDLELHQHMFMRALFESLGLTFDVDYGRLEIDLWSAAAPGRIAPGVDRVMDYLASRGIRTGVVSNLSFSAAALTERINRMIPNNRFELIMTSSEYGFRKPSGFIFRAALRKTGLPAEKVFFCGDNLCADVLGASGVGMFPVWYRSPLAHKVTERDEAKGVEHLYIEDWEQLIEHLDNM